MDRGAAIGWLGIAVVAAVSFMPVPASLGPETTGDIELTGAVRGAVGGGHRALSIAHLTGGDHTPPSSAPLCGRLDT